MLGLNRLISHRFRGFSERENTIAGLNAALDFGVLNLEFDIRVARCGTPVIYHDEYAYDAQGKKRLLCEHMFSEFSALGGDFDAMPTADTLFQAAANKASAQLLIDIKDFGFELEIDALVRAHGLLNRATYVSWLPDVLYRMSEIAPDIPLCLSHWCQNPNALIQAKHAVFETNEGKIPRGDRRYIHGERSGWFVEGGLKGELLDILVGSNGSVCVPQDMVTTDTVEYYHDAGLKISTFSYVDWPHIERHETEFGMDWFFIDDKAVFDTIQGHPKA